MTPAGEYREWPDAADLIGDEAIRFTLAYQGELPSAQNNPRTKEKHAIRAALHPQMKVLWEQSPELLNAKAQGDDPHRMGNMMLKGKIHSHGRHELLHQMIQVSGTHMHLWFIPLITEHNGLGVELDIKFMRPGRPGGVIVGGDLDNRLKTLFDGLRMPHDGPELPEDGWVPPNNGQFYCLLQDDCLITGVSVSTERLLTPVSGSESEVRLEIGVKVVVIAPNKYNSPYRE